jgi:hypothetical protein
MALRPTRETAQTPVPATVPSSTRLDCGTQVWCGAGRRLCSGRPGGHPVFLMSGRPSTPIRDGGRHATTS